MRQPDCCRQGPAEALYGVGPSSRQTLSRRWPSCLVGFRCVLGATVMAGAGSPVQEVVGRPARPCDEEGLPVTVSAVIPSFNHARFVTQAIDSVLGQSFTELELIIVDDGSTDGSADVIRRHLAVRAPAIPVRFVHRPNRGLCRTINEGLSIAGGRYVALLASDDTWE